MTFRRPTLLVAAALLAAPAAAHASPDRFVIRGAGFGHGVGMSQYGALGYAIHGAGYRDILGHYYTGTGLGRLTSTPTVRVLLSSTRRTATFAGADRVGDRALTPSRTYGVRGRADGALELLSPKRRRLAVLTGPLRVTGPAPLWTGARAYRGALELSAGPGGGVDVVNAVDLESYLQGVVPAESPATWPAEALKAQAVAARSYAVTTGRGGALFDQYADTRSQVYAGVGVETAATNAAVAATRGEVVTYGGRPVTTFFFSTSGGRTEDVENTPLGHTPLPWLRSVPDPYDNVSPRHRWRPAQMTLKQAGAKLRGLVRGRFVGIRVVQRGASPRVVAADVLGTRGAVRVTGGTLRARLGLLDTWAYFTTITARPAPPPPVTGPPAPTTGAPAAAQRYAGAVTGRIVGGRRGDEVFVEARSGRSWRTTGRTTLSAAGTYRVGVASAGTYRVRSGPAVSGALRVG